MTYLKAFLLTLLIFMLTYGVGCLVVAFPTVMLYVLIILAFILMFMMLVELIGG